MKHATKRAYRIRNLSIVVMMTLGIAVTASGCVIAIDDDLFRSADLEVTWTINGSDSASLCGVYGVDSWMLEVRGPESRNVVLDCRDNYWSSENDLLSLPEGSYDVRLTALDHGDRQIGKLATSLYLWDDGHVEHLSLDLIDSDFHE